MKKRPISITIVSWIYIAVGCMGLLYHSSEWKTPGAEHWQIVWVSAIRALAIVAGIYMLRAQNWARWLAIVWIAVHVVISMFDSWQPAAMHAVLLAVIVYLLIRRPAKLYFSGTSA